MHVAGVFEACGQLLEDDGAPLGGETCTALRPQSTVVCEPCWPESQLRFALFAGRAVAAFAEFGDVQMAERSVQTST